ncbi:inositol hexakisphosphate-domain-containing protein [Scenedesmus sp. NREL 46B-D3]|nr:inositol hexakisphosphate-domain-containing protein [Scenedesmus sp. NREL 46B-D3]
MALRKTGSGDATELAVAGWAKPEDVVRSRAGDVLIKNTLLKADHFPGCQNTKLTPLLDGAPNFRQVEGLPVYGVAIPTVRGLRNVMDVLGAAQGQRGVLWHNMREEPVLYINGKPYVVRESDQPFRNVEYTGIDRSRVEDMEARLKRDVLREAARYEQHILVTEEDDDMNVIDVWEPVTESDVQTPMEVYQELVEDGYNVDYTRVPITDEKAPKDSDFELLIQRLWNVPPDAALVFNCQMGRGRTTTGMVIATLVTLRRLGAFNTAAQLAGQHQPMQQQQQQVANGNGMYFHTASSGVSYGSQLQQQSVPAWFATSKAARFSGAGGLGSTGTLGSPTGVGTPRGTDDKLKAGMYGVVRSLLRVLERGGAGKAILDTCLDACNAMQNLREAIATYRGRLMAESKESRRAQLMGVCLEYLERYYMLIAFTSYLTWPKFDPAAPGHVTFQDWMDSRPELRSVLSRMLRRNPLSALELHIPAATLLQDSPAGHQGADDDADQTARSQAEARADGIIESRSGAVLGALTILKEDYFPGMKSSRLPQVLPGAGNFRRTAGPPVYGVAMCTLGGIRNVLNAVAQQQEQAGGPKTVMWFNMREEPMVYINGLPFVLREQQRPMKNLQEYAGIDAERLERMEARLKQDVLAEAAHHNGRILVARESAAAPGSLTEQHHSGTGELVDMWEAVAGPGAVQTPAEVYAALAAEGLRVRYLRVPVTDGKAPSAGDIDAIMRQVASLGYQHPMVFNCQMGAGRTTTGTVIGGLLAMYGANVQLPGSAAAADGSANGAGAAGGAALTPVRALLALPSSTSMDDLSIDIIREELAGDSPRNSEDSDRDSPHFTADLELPGALSGGTTTAEASSVAAAPEPAQVPRCSSVAELWSDLSPEEVQERVSLAAGGYVGVRRVVRLLEHGDNAKRIVDAVIDASAQMLNLRVAIMRFRRPKHQYHNHKSEVAARHFAYRRGSAYLERYCLLVALGAYLEAEGLRSATSFEAWLDARPELKQALSSIHSNPATALAAVPVAAMPVLYRSVRGGVEVTPAEQEEVLRKRRGKTLNRRIILKSYLARAADPSLPRGTPDVRQAEGLPVFAVGNVAYDALAKLLLHLGAGPGGNTHVVVTDVREELVVYVNGVPHIRRELEMPAAALHHAGVHARQLELLEAALREDVANEAAKWGGRVLLHQELYTASAEAVRRMSGVVAGGSATPGGSLSIAIPGRAGSSLLPLPIVGSFLTPPTGPVSATAAQLASAIAPSPIAPAGTAVQQARRILGQLPPISPAASAGAAANGAAADPAGFPGFRPISPSPFAASPAGVAGRAATGISSQVLAGPEGGAAASNTAGEDVTAPVDVRPGAAVVPYWESVELGDSGESAPPAEKAAAASHASRQQQRLRAPPLAACLDVAKQLQAAGLHITYRRIPLSRERTPVPSDLGDMMKQMLALPAGVGPLDIGSPGGCASPRAAQMMRMAAQCAADADRTWGGFDAQTAGSGGADEMQADQGEQQQRQPRSIVHLVVSRTATGSSARFATAAFSTFLTKHSRSESKAAAAGAPGSPHKPGAAAAAAANGAAAGSADGSPSQGPAKRMRRSHSDLGEYRGIMSVARLLPGGLEVKGAVDEAIDRCSAIGNLREDIKACKHNAAAPGQSSDDPGSMAWAARQLGVHYLKRYFLLVAFRCYLVQRQRAEQLGRSAPDFTKWMEDRRELGHLMHHINLDT